jgi:hypothetical protein
MLCLFFFMILLEQVIKYKFKYILNLSSIEEDLKILAFSFSSLFHWDKK